MEQYIKKDALVAEIEKLETALKNACKPNSFSNIEECMNAAELEALDVVKDIIETLEVEDLDLEKEINKYISDNFFGSETMGFFAARTKEEPNDIDMALCAKHFFELGLKAQKGV